MRAKAVSSTLAGLSKTVGRLTAPHLSPHHSGPAVIQNRPVLGVLEPHLDSKHDGPGIVCGLLVRHSTSRLVWETHYQDSVSVALQCVFALSGFRQKAQEAGEKKIMLESHKSNFKTVAHKVSITCPSRSSVIVMIIFLFPSLKSTDRLPTLLPLTA